MKGLRKTGYQTRREAKVDEICDVPIRHEAPWDGTHCPHKGIQRPVDSKEVSQVSLDGIKLAGICVERLGCRWRQLVESTTQNFFEYVGDWQDEETDSATCYQGDGKDYPQQLVSCTNSQRSFPVIDRCSGYALTVFLSVKRTVSCEASAFSDFVKTRVHHARSKLFRERRDSMQSFRCLYHIFLATYQSNRLGIVNGQHKAYTRRSVVAKSLVHHLDLARFI